MVYAPDPASVPAPSEEAHFLPLEIIGEATPPVLTQLRAEDEATDEWQFSGFAVERQEYPDGSALWIHDDRHAAYDGSTSFAIYRG